jgi:CubicO group peptidase (beta-lactamase class C family)
MGRRIQTYTVGVLIIGALAASALAWRGQDQTRPLDAAVDAVFAKWTRETPGCAVGASVGGSPVLRKAYGMADLERAAPNTPDTIFEAGSVSKQFTAAAVLLLAREGKLSLDDPARKYIPELPDYAGPERPGAPAGAPLTIRHMLTHTSGLRDWGSVAAIGGWPRTTRAYTHAHVLDIVSRQRALNFTPGTRWSYSNTGYNLAATIVSRVSGMPFAEFTRARIFAPLGMASTSWRDDHRRIVKGRAIAYSDEDGRFEIEMPFEDVHGNGGLLTTVGDLLRWNDNFVEPKVGDAVFVSEQQQPGRFGDGRAHDYAFGLRLAGYKGVREVGHSGSTAGYRAHLVRYPDRRVSVAVLCNASSGRAGDYAHAVADLYLKDHLKMPPSAEVHKLSEAELETIQGIYRQIDTGAPMTVAVSADGLRIVDGPALVARTGRRFEAENGGRKLDLEAGGRLRVTDRFGGVETFERVPPATPTADALRAFASEYRSDEAETTLTAVVENGGLALKRRPDSLIKLTPVYADAFTGSIGFVRFHRDPAGRVREMSIAQDRVWDLRLRRVERSVPSDGALRN